MDESNKECREEGERAFLSNPYDIDRNPYSILGDEEESRKRQQWQCGWENAQREAERNED